MLKHTLMLPLLFLGLFLNAQTTVVDVVVNSEDHTLLEAAVIEADLVGALSGDGPFTVFAPTDAAVTALVTALDITPDQLLALPNLADILTYHVLGANVLSTDLMAEQTVTMLNGDDATVTSMGGTVMVNGVATVTTADITTDNGVVHVIDAVLLPPTTTVVDVIVNSEDHTLLEAAVGAADLVGALSGDGPFTVFAPTDAAIVELVTALDITADELLALPELGAILQYHVVGAAALSTDLSDGQLLTTLQGDDVEISIDMGVMVNDANVVVADLVADNGVVHVIDMVLSLPSGVDQVALADLFNVFPNPTTDVLRWNGVAVDRIRVIDTQGRVRLETTNAVGSLDLSSLENGVFMVVIEADGQRAVKSVLKH